MHCDGCRLHFDEAERRPKVMSCGHTLCIACLSARKMCDIHKQDILDVNGLPDNFYIISLLKGNRADKQKRRFYCITCKATAQPTCEDEHDICSLEKARKTEVGPMLEVVRRTLKLQGSVASNLMSLLPNVADTFQRVLETATMREEELQRTLTHAQSVLESSGNQAAWEAATQSLKRTALQCDQELPQLTRLLGILEFQGQCRQMEVEFKDGEEMKGFCAWNDDGIFFKPETEVSRALRLITFILASLGYLQFQDEENDNEAPEPESNGESDSDAAAGGFGHEEASGWRVTRQAHRSTTSRRCRVDKENYELLKTLDDQDAVASMHPFECPVCLQDYQAGEGLVLKGCLHVFCRDCLKNTVEHSTDASIKCPFQDDQYSCESIITQREIRTLVPERVFDQYLERSVRQAESGMDNTFHCKTLDCTGWCQFEPGVNQFFCPVCNRENCLQCQVIHEPEDCAGYQERIRQAAATDAEARATRDALDALLAAGEAMRCPGCTVVIMKRSGCDALVCAQCKLEICWATKQARWGPNGRGDTSGGCRCNVNNRRCHPKCSNCH